MTTTTKTKALVLCIIVAAFCYGSALQNQLVLDDIPVVRGNPAIRHITPIEFLKSPYWLTNNNPGIYRPLTVFSLSVDYALWGLWTPGFHSTNILIHALNAWLLFLLIGTFMEGMTIPGAAALIYLMHPVHTEAVITIVGRSELLAALFFFAAWFFYRTGRTALVAPSFLASLLCKENAIVLPAVLVMDTYLSQGLDGRKVLARWKSLAGTAIAAVIYLGLRVSVLHGLGVPPGAQYMGGRLSLLERWMTSGRVFLQYFRLVLAPIDVAGDYDFNSIPIAHILDWSAWIGLLLVVAVILLAYYYRRRNWLVSFGFLFAILALIPTSNWIMPIAVLMSERLLYLPMAGLSLVGAVAFHAIGNRKIQALVATGWIVTALMLCLAHNYIWQNDFTFYRNMTRVVPDNAKGRLGYGFALIEAGMMREATDQLEAGLRIIPNNPALLTTLAITKMKPKSCDDAWPLLRQSLQINPKHGDTLRRVADCFFREANWDQANAAYQTALNYIRFPDSQMLLNWGRTLENLNQKDSAISAYERAALVDPQNRVIRKRIAFLKSAEK